MHWLAHLPRPAAAVDRRVFLRSVGGAGAGLVLGVGAARDAAAQASGAAAILRADGQPAGPAFNGFVRVAPDNTVTVLIKHLEMGQGPYTGLTTLVAEELDADWAQMRAQHAPADVALYKNLAFGMQGTGGSTAIANSYDQMRQAGAAARFMLVGAAAQAWGVPAAEVRAARGVLTHAKSGRRATFGQLAERAAAMSPPVEVTLKDPARFRLIGTPLPRLDSAAKSNGSARFTLDLDVPGALTVLVLHPPRFGALPQAVDDAAARRVRGVVDVKPIPPYGVAVYADGFWAAKQGREALVVTWDESKAEQRGTPELQALYRGLAGRTGSVAVTRGSPEAASGGRVIEAEYLFPYLAHAPLEPLDCTLELRDGACRAWLGSQLQTLDHQVVAKGLGLAPERVTIQTQLAGGSFGRRAQPASDLAAEATAALKALGRDAAIKLAWTREDDIAGGRYRPMFVHKVRASLDANGRLATWDQVIVGQSFIKGSPFEAMIKDGIDPTMVEGAQDMPYAVPNLRVSVHTVEVGVPTLWWRSVGHTHTGYVTETLIDELLAAGGQDAVAGRLALLGDRHPREAGVLRAVAQAARWSGPKVANGRARGVALHKSFDTYVAQVAEVSRGADGLPKVERVWCAVDCGVAVNPDNIRSQIEGGIGFGLGAVLYDEITLDQGRVVQSNFNDYRMLRIGEMPRVEVVVVRSSEKPTGVGEPGVPPIGPAVANAWRALTGTAVRELPFTRSLGARA